MRGARSLVSLLITAVAVGSLLVLFKPEQRPQGSGQSDKNQSPEAYVEETLGLRFKSAPVMIRVSTVSYTHLTLPTKRIV